MSVQHNDACDICDIEIEEISATSKTGFGVDVGAIVVGGDFQGLGIVRNLTEYGIPVRVIDHEFSIGRFSRYVQKYHKISDVNDESLFIEFLVGLAKQEGLRGWVVFPTTDRVAAILSRYKDYLSPYLRIWTPGWEIVSQVYDKRLTLNLAERAGVPHPKTIVARAPGAIADSELRFPVIVKPAIKDNFYPGTKSKAFLARNKKELAEQFSRGAQVVDAQELMIQEVIPGGSECQYSYCALFKYGEVKARLMARRTRQHPMDFGHASTFVETVDIPELENQAIKLLKTLDYYGLCEVEFKHDARDNQYKLLEVNARTWGWHSLGRRAGVNFSYLLFLDQVGVEIPVSKYRVGVKWLRSITDLPTFFKEWRGGRMRPADYLASFRGEIEPAVFSLRDPLPFFMELMIAPYLKRKRGF